MEQDIGISVAMCTYDGREYVEDQLDSILNQTLEPQELVICDDASSDGTVDILEKYRSRHPNLIEIHKNKQNLGVPGNVEQCIQLCDGDAIAICDQDDIWKPEKLEKQATALINNDVRLVFHNSTVVTESLEPIDDLWTIGGYTPGTARSPHQALQQLVHGNFVQGASAMFDGELVQHFLPFPENCIYDHYIAIVAAAMGEMYDIDEELLLNRQHPGQVVGVDPDENIVQRLQKIRRTNRSNLHESASIRWQSVRNAIQEIDEAELEIPQDELFQFIENKHRYESNEAAVYSSEYALSDKLRRIHQNWSEEWYVDYGTWGRLTVLKDIGGAITAMFR